LGIQIDEGRKIVIQIVEFMGIRSFGYLSANQNVESFAISTP